MTAGKERFWSYARPNGPIAIPCTQRTNWSRSPTRPGAGSSSARTTAARMRPPIRVTTCPRRQPAGVIAASDPLGRPVALGEAVHPPELGDLPAECTHRVGHLAVVPEEPRDLTL